MVLLLPVVDNSVTPLSHLTPVVPTYGIRLYYHVIRRHQSVSCQNIGLSACMISRIAVSRLWSEYNPG